MRTAVRCLTVWGAFLFCSSTASAQNSDASFQWTSGIEAGRTVYVRNLNGAIRVESATGASASVRAEKRWHRGDPNDVKITAEKTAHGDLLICAIWEGRNTDCDEEGYRSKGSWWRNRDNDVSVDFTIALPAGVKLDVSTVNGSLTVRGASAAITARTVNGSIEAASTSGPVNAKTVNGSIRAGAGAFGNTDVALETVNGSITLELPDGLNANLVARTVNGSVIAEDFPITVQGRIDRHRLEGKIGKGGHELRVTTVNGSIRLRKG